MLRLFPVVLLLLVPAFVHAEEKLILTGKNNGKTVAAAVGQIIEIRLTNEHEGPEVRGGSVVTTNPKRTMNCDEFEPKYKDNKTSTLGIYIYRYEATKEGASVIRVRQLSPSGPIPMPRDATKKIAEFGVTIEVK